MSFTPQQSSVPPSQLHAAQQSGMMQGYPPGLLPTGLPPPPMPPPFPVFSVPPPSQPVMKQPAVLTGRPMISPRFTKRVGDTRPQYRPPIGDKPTVTVFVGNITEHASDALIRQLLMKCGIVVNWKRVQGADGKLQAFGFCEYIDAETGLRAIRLLHDLTVGDKNLVVKVDAKTKEMLEEYKKKKAAAKGSNISSETKPDEEAIDEETKKEDAVVMKTIQGLMSDNADVLSGKFAGTVSKWRATHSGSEENLDGMGMDKAQKHLISKEIRFFRDTYKDSEKQKTDSGKDEKENDKENKDKENVRVREKSREKSREKERPKEGRSNERDYGERRRDEERNRDRSRSRDRNNSSRDERDKERRQNRERDLDEEEQYEKRKRERKQKERNQMFLDRLKNWEGRERKKYREYERELEKDREQEIEQSREKKHLLEFLEDYDDEKDDPKYYRGGSFDRRMQARLQEMELDDKDRQRELEEIEEIRKTLGESAVTTTTTVPSAAVVVSTVKEEEPMEEEESAVPTVQPEPEQKPMLQATFKPATHAVESAPKVSSPVQDAPKASPKATAVANNKPTQEEKAEVEGESTTNKKAFGFEMKKTNMAGSSKKLEAVFNSEEDATNEQTGKRKLVPLEYSEEEMKAVAAVKTAEDKKKSIKALIERIPTAKDELFAYTLDWECVDQMLIDRRIRPWVNKKIVEYIGEEEPSLVDFMCSKLLARSQPENILHDVSMVLDDEAEVFVVKMWRLLIYETEAKKIGLVK